MRTLFKLHDYESFEDLTNKKVCVSLSGGINSAAVLCYLATVYPKELRPRKIWIFYAHLKEHSPGTLRFVRDLIRYAKKHFEVELGFHNGSVNAFFRSENFIPHPILSPCSDHLKRMPMEAFKKKHKIDVDLIGYVRSERRRIKRQIEKGVVGKVYPIAHLTDEDCFELVGKEVGWYPDIYNIKERGKRVFLHNNCLPCKNFDGSLLPNGSASDRYLDVKKYYPSYFEEARKTAEQTGSFWGREKDFDGHCKFCEFESTPDLSKLPIFNQEAIAHE